VRFVEMEYGLPRAALPEAFAGLRRIIESLPFRVVFPVEVRFTAADDIWLSHGYGRESAYIAIHQFVGMPYEPFFSSAVEKTPSASVVPSASIILSFACWSQGEMTTAAFGMAASPFGFVTRTVRMPTPSGSSHT
jgi:hypothetical protein